MLSVPTAAFRALVLGQDPTALKVTGKLGQMMVRRLQERDRDLLSAYRAVRCSGLIRDVRTEVGMAKKSRKKKARKKSAANHGKRPNS